jgi:SAM-dependent MidA family methyltransferase
MHDDRERPVASLVRDPLPDPESVGEDEVLVERIRAEIRESGPIPFARFMERALYEPGHGYYRRPEPGPGRGGDFLTAPEAHPIFGAAVGRLLEQAWKALDRPDPFVVREPGAGGGALAVGLLTGLRDAASPLLEAIRYRPVELEPARIAAFRAGLVAAGFATRLEEPSGDDDAPTGAVVANEVLDALPVHRVIGRPSRLRELLVGLDGAARFESVEADPTTDELADRLAVEGIDLEDGQAAEICLGIDGWLAGATAGLERGVVVLVDYAEEPASLYAPRRRDGTLRGFARHGVGGDPFRHVGRQDLTATVDLAAVRAAAARAGLGPVGETTQAELLAATTGDVASSILHRPGATLEDALLLRSALARLLDPRGMGGYRVMVFGRGLPAGVELPGLRRLQAPARPQPDALR